MTLYCDASKTGWGATFQGIKAQGHFTAEQREKCINTLEVLAGLYGFLSFKHLFTGNHLLIKSDNTTAIAFFNQMGGLSSHERDAPTRLLWQEAQSIDCWISATHIPGSENLDADQASRIFNQRTEWTLPTSIFTTLAERFGLPSIDLFASRLNHKLNLYVSWIPDPFCTEVDAFTVDWHSHYPYIFAPFNIIHRCINKIQYDRVDKTLIVFPVWPNQPWFAQLLKLLTSHIYIIPKNPPLTLPWEDPPHQQLHPMSKSLILAAATLSTTPWKLKDYQMQLCPASPTLFDQPLRKITRPAIRDGLTFATPRGQIPLVPL